MVTDFLILLLGNPQGFLASRRNVKKKKATESKKQKKQTNQNGLTNIENNLMTASGEGVE